MRRLLALLTGVVVLLSFVSCNNGTTGGSVNSSSSDSQSVSTSSEPSSQLTSSDQASSSDTSSDATSSIDDKYGDMIPRKDVSLKNMSFGRVFYRAKQATTVYVIDVSGQSVQTVEMLRSLQGLVTRKQGGTVYLHNGSDASDFWLDYCSAEYGVYFENISISDALKKFSGHIKGAVTYNPDVSYELTVARNIAIQYDYLVSTGDAVFYTSPITVNKPVMSVKDQFADKRSAYNYIIDNCVEKSSTRYVALTGEDTAFFDYIYAVKALVLDFDFSEQWEVEMLSLITGRPDWNETAYVFSDRNVSEALKNVFSVDGFAVINIGDLENSTFFSSVNASFSGRGVHHNINKLSQNKVYVSLCLRIDSISDIQDGVYEAWRKKTAASRISVEFYPVLYEIAPPIAKWFVQNLTANDMLISADLGCGNANLSLMSESTAKKFRKNNEYFLEACGITVLNDGKNMYIAEEYYDSISGLSFSEPSKTIAAVMKFIDIDGLGHWLASTVPVEGSPIYFLIELPSSALGSSGFDELGDMIYDIQRERMGVFEFVLSENLLKYM